MTLNNIDGYRIKQAIANLISVLLVKEKEAQQDNIDLAVSSLELVKPY